MINNPSILGAIIDDILVRYLFIFFCNFWLYFEWLFFSFSILVFQNLSNHFRQHEQFFDFPTFLRFERVKICWLMNLIRIRRLWLKAANNWNKVCGFWRWPTCWIRWLKILLIGSFGDSKSTSSNGMHEGRFEAKAFLSWKWDASENQLILICRWNYLANLFWFNQLCFASIGYVREFRKLKNAPYDPAKMFYFKLNIAK